MSSRQTPNSERLAHQPKVKESFAQHEECSEPGDSLNPPETYMEKMNRLLSQYSTEEVVLFFLFTELDMAIASHLVDMLIPESLIMSRAGCVFKILMFAVVGYLSCEILVRVKQEENEPEAEEVTFSEELSDRLDHTLHALIEGCGPEGPDGKLLDVAEVDGMDIFNKLELMDSKVTTYIKRSGRRHEALLQRLGDVVTQNTALKQQLKDALRREQSRCQNGCQGPAQGEDECKLDGNEASTRAFRLYVTSRVRDRLPHNAEDMETLKRLLTAEEDECEGMSLKRVVWQVMLRYRKRQFHPLPPTLMDPSKDVDSTLFRGEDARDEIVALFKAAFRQDMVEEQLRSQIEQQAASYNILSERFESVGRIVNQKDAQLFAQADLIHRMEREYADWSSSYTKQKDELEALKQREAQNIQAYLAHKQHANYMSQRGEDLASRARVLEAQVGAQIDAFNDEVARLEEDQREALEGRELAHSEAVAEINRKHQAVLAEERAQLKLKHGKKMKELHNELSAYIDKEAGLEKRCEALRLNAAQDVHGLHQAVDELKGQVAEAKTIQEASAQKAAQDSLLIETMSLEVQALKNENEELSDVKEWQHIDGSDDESDDRKSSLTWTEDVCEDGDEEVEIITPADVEAVNPENERTP